MLFYLLIYQNFHCWPYLIYFPIEKSYLSYVLSLRESGLKNTVKLHNTLSYKCLTDKFLTWNICRQQDLHPLWFCWKHICFRFFIMGLTSQLRNSACEAFMGLRDNSTACLEPNPDNKFMSLLKQHLKIAFNRFLSIVLDYKVCVRVLVLFSPEVSLVLE